MNTIPKPQHPLGYTEHQVKEILDALRIDGGMFWEAFDAKDCATNEFGANIYYTLDVQKALYRLGHKTKVAGKEK